MCSALAGVSLKIKILSLFILLQVTRYIHRYILYTHTKYGTTSRANHFVVFEYAFPVNCDTKAYQ
jgi:hypothetical protein